MENYTLEITEQEVWAITTALFEYQKNPISEEHGKLALSVYLQIKDEILARSEKRFLESRQNRTFIQEKK